MSLEEISLDPAAAQLVSFAGARRMGAVPVAVGDDQVLAASRSPTRRTTSRLDDVSMFTGMQIRPVVVSQEDLDDAAQAPQRARRRALVEDRGDRAPRSEGVQFESPDDAPTIKLVRSIISEAVDRGVSDIHFAPDDGALTVRFRIDGVMATPRASRAARPRP